MKSCGRHCNYTTNDIINAEVFHSQCIQDDTARIERHHHQEEHAEVEHQRVLRNAFIIFGCLIGHSESYIPRNRGGLKGQKTKGLKGSGGTGDFLCDTLRW